MLKIRLCRVGKKNRAQFRVAVADGRRAPGGRFIEVLGHYDPHTKEKVFKKERIEYWISKGAQPSSTVHNFLVDAGIIKAEKVTSWKPKKKEKTVEEKKQEASAIKKEAPVEAKSLAENKEAIEAKK